MRKLIKKITYWYYRTFTPCVTLEFPNENIFSAGEFITTPNGVKALCVGKNKFKVLKSVTSFLDTQCL